jgi:transposase
MKRARYRTFSDEFKRDAVRLAEKSPRSLPDIADSLGVGRSTLHSWYSQEMAKRKKTARSPVAVPPGNETLKEENARMKRELELALKRIDSLETDREILKKAAAFFAKESE